MSNNIITALLGLVKDHHYQYHQNRAGIIIVIIIIIINIKLAVLRQSMHLFLTLNFLRGRWIYI